MGRHFQQTKEGQSAKIQRRHVSKLQVVIVARSLRNMWLQGKLAHTLPAKEFTLFLLNVDG